MTNNAIRYAGVYVAEKHTSNYPGPADNGLFISMNVGSRTMSYLQRWKLERIWGYLVNENRLVKRKIVYESGKWIVS